MYAASLLGGGVSIDYSLRSPPPATISLVSGQLLRLDQNTAQATRMDGFQDSDPTPANNWFFGSIRQQEPVGDLMFFQALSVHLETLEHGPTECHKHLPLKQSLGNTDLA